MVLPQIHRERSMKSRIVLLEKMLIYLQSQELRNNIGIHASTLIRERMYLKRCRRAVRQQPQSQICSARLVYVLLFMNRSESQKENAIGRPAQEAGGVAAAGFVDEGSQLLSACLFVETCLGVEPRSFSPLS